MPEITTLAIFIPTFFFISITPGLCMSLAMSLGMTIGIKKTLWMMLGEVIGVALVGFFAVLGVAGLMLKYPTMFLLFKWLGGAYLVYVGMATFKTSVKINTVSQLTKTIPKRSSLAAQGFVTAIANPKGWAFMISILPPFVDVSKPLAPQLSILLFIIMLSEFICMIIYATGGKGLKQLLNRHDKAQWINRIGGILLILVGVWLAIS